MYCYIDRTGADVSRITLFGDYDYAKPLGGFGMYILQGPSSLSVSRTMRIAMRRFVKGVKGGVERQKKRRE